MSDEATVDRIEERLNRLDQVTVTDESSAHVALGHALATVGAINQGIEQQPTYGLSLSSDSIIAKLERWLQRLVDKLTQIVRALAKATSFAVSVGTGVSVTINFPPMGQA